MKLTNKHGFPEAMARAILNDPYRMRGDISVTSLISPPRIYQLRKRHRDEITEDVTEYFWRLFGQAVHTVLERAEDVKAPELVEARCEVEMGGWVVSGKPDLWTAPDLLQDWKFTSLYALQDGTKPEWEQQLNYLAHIYRSIGLAVNRLEIVAVFRDWSKPRAGRERNYPQAGGKVHPVKVWSDEEARAHMGIRVGRHQAAASLPDDELPMCTDAERWAKPKVYAVKKKGNKRAIPGGLCPTRTAAEARVIQAENQTGKAHEIEIRPGSYPRCETYCEVAPFCSQWQSQKAAA